MPMPKKERPECRVADCVAPSKCVGLCTRHYDRANRDDLTRVQIESMSPTKLRWQYGDYEMPRNLIQAEARLQTIRAELDAKHPERALPGEPTQAPVATSAKTKTRTVPFKEGLAETRLFLDDLPPSPVPPSTVSLKSPLPSKINDEVAKANVRLTQELKEVRAQAEKDKTYNAALIEAFNKSAAEAEQSIRTLNVDIGRRQQTIDQLRIQVADLELDLKTRPDPSPRTNTPADLLVFSSTLGSRGVPRITLTGTGVPRVSSLIGRKVIVTAE